MKAGSTRILPEFIWTRFAKSLRQTGLAACPGLIVASGGEGGNGSGSGARSPALRRNGGFFFLLPLNADDRRWGPLRSFRPCDTAWRLLRDRTRNGDIADGVVPAGSGE